MLDLLILTLGLGFVWAGWRQGLMKDVLHFVLWISMGGLLAYTLLSSLDPKQIEPSQAYSMVKHLLGVFGVAYVMMWLVEKFVILPALFGPGKHIPSETSRIFGALFGLMKIVTLVFAGTFLFQVYSRSADPELPALLEKSVIVKSANSFASDLYEHVTDEGHLEYNKIVWEEPPVKKAKSALQKIQQESFFDQLLNEGDL